MPGTASGADAPERRAAMAKPREQSTRRAGMIRHYKEPVFPISQGFGDMRLKSQKQAQSPEPRPNRSECRQLELA